MHVRKNDTVVLLKDFSGPSPARKGSTARVLKVFPRRGLLICEGVNVKHKHIRANTNRDYPRGGIIRKEAPIDISNVLPVDPKTNQPTRVGFRIRQDGAKERFARRSGESLGVVTKANKAKQG